MHSVTWVKIARREQKMKVEISKMKPKFQELCKSKQLYPSQFRKYDFEFDIFPNEIVLL